MINRAGLRRLRKLVSDLELPEEFGLDEAIAAVERKRGRRIVCLSTTDLDETAEVGGLVVSSPSMDVDVIFYAASLSAWMRQHAIGHELGHLVAGHTTARDELPQDIIDILTPALQQSYHNPLLEAMLAGEDLVLRGRHQFNDAQEQEAEVFAGLLVFDGQAGVVDPGCELLVRTFQPRPRRKRT